MPQLTVTIALGDREVAALDHYIDTHRSGRSRADVIAEIVALWVSAQEERQTPPDEGLRPDELNASNDA